MQKTSAHLLAARLVVDLVQAAWQQHMRRVHVHKAPVPPDQRNLVQGRRVLRRIRKIDPGARTALDPKVSIPRILRDHVISRIEPRSKLERVVPGPIVDLRQRPARIHVDQQRAQRPHAGLIHPVAQSLDRAAVTERIDQELVGIDRQSPVAIAMTELQPVQPVRAEPASAVTGLCRPKRHIVLAGKQLAPPVGRSVVHEQEVTDTQAAIVLQEKRQPGELVPDGDKHKNVPRRDLRRPVGDNGQFPALSKCPKLELAPFHPQSERRYGTQGPSPPPAGCRTRCQIRLNTRSKCFSQVGS